MSSQTTDKTEKTKKNGLTNLGIGIISGIIILFAVVFIISLTIPAAEPLDYVIRIFGLFGYIGLAIATIMTPFLKQIGKVFGKPFLKIHHLFAIIGLSCITVHPVALAIKQMSLLVFLPSFASFYSFWALAGRPALILIYIAIVGVFLRKRMQKYWRGFHRLMYLALLFGIVHADLIGTDIKGNIALLLIFNILFVITQVTAFVKVYQKVQMKKLMEARKAQKANQSN